MAYLVRYTEVSRGATFYGGRAVLNDPGPRLRRRDFCEVLAVVEGSGWHELSLIDRPGPREPLEPGQLFFVRPRDVHRFGGSGLNILYVGFPIGAWQALMSLSGLDETWFMSDEVPRARFDPGDEDVIRPFLTAIEKVGRGPTMFDLLRFWADVVPVFVDAARDRQRMHLPSWLFRALDRMRDEANLRGGIPRLAELSHVSASHLSRSVRRHLGVTPTEILTELRLTHAAALLRTTDDSVGLIASRCGFSSGRYFSTRFRDQYQLAPTEYRRAAARGLVAA